MKLSMDSGSLTKKLDNITAVKLIKDAGFDAVDWSFFSWFSEEDDLLSGDYIKKARKLREYMDSIGMVCNQAHAEMTFTHNDSMDVSNTNYLRMVRSLEVSSILGAENIIIHPVASVLSTDIGYLDYSREYLRSFIPYCERFNIHISVENMFGVRDRKIVGIDTYSTAKEHIEFVQSIDSEWFNICLDVGHCNVVGIDTPEDAVRQIGPKLLRSVHIHDNNGRTDQHLIPYLGMINWDNVARSLKDIGYSGDFTFEASTFYYEMPIELLEPALRLAEQTGRFIMKKI